MIISILKPQETSRLSSSGWTRSYVPYRESSLHPAISSNHHNHLLTHSSVSCNCISAVTDAETIIIRWLRTAITMCEFIQKWLVLMHPEDKNYDMLCHTTWGLPPLLTWFELLRFLLPHATWSVHLKWPWKCFLFSFFGFWPKKTFQKSSYLPNMKFNEFRRGLFIRTQVMCFWWKPLLPACVSLQMFSHHGGRRQSCCWGTQVMCFGGNLCYLHAFLSRRFLTMVGADRAAVEEQK